MTNILLLCIDWRRIWSPENLSSVWFSPNTCRYKWSLICFILCDVGIVLDQIISSRPLLPCSLLVIHHKVYWFHQFKFGFFETDYSNSSFYKYDSLLATLIAHKSSLRRLTIDQGALRTNNSSGSTNSTNNSWKQWFI